MNFDKTKDGITQSSIGSDDFMDERNQPEHQKHESLFE